jgi:hypothetical protein
MQELRKLYHAYINNYLSKTNFICDGVAEGEERRMADSAKNYLSGGTLIGKIFKHYHTVQKHLKFYWKGISVKSKK